jgi:hypothetical protein
VTVATSCRLRGHRVRFWAEGSTMRWACERECGMSGSKEYEDPRSARIYAAAFDREDHEDLGRRAPLSIAVFSALRRRFHSEDSRETRRG